MITINHGSAFTTPPKIRYKGGRYVDKYKVTDLYVDHSVTKEPLNVDESLLLNVLDNDVFIENQMLSGNNMIYGRSPGSVVRMEMMLVFKSYGSMGQTQVTVQKKGNEWVKRKSIKTKAGGSVKAKAESCPWYLQCSKLPNEETWSVKTFDDTHKCLQSRIVKKCTASFLSKSVEESIKPNPKIPLNALKDQL
ncbi:hypothetical protein Tco_0703944 [Tanacetum coccineum]|uniref:Transposase MuDR plant domain-containing protein n=1 Tax=Tanacetum coccineum TaxID=301880 RepID=A0ABQ4Y286_9ASTR